MLQGARRLGAGCALAGLALVAALSPRLVPFSMDEFVHYTPLACAAHPETRALALGDEACGTYDLIPPWGGAALPLRSYLYIGSLPAPLFAPFWWAAGAPWATRVQGALLGVAFAALMARVAGVSLRRAGLALLVFPALPLACLVDVGPTGLSLVSLAGALLALGAACGAATLPRALVLGACAGAAVFLGLWTKLPFAWTLPGLSLFALWRARACSPRRALAVLGIAAACAALPALALLASIDADGQRYAAVATGADLNLGRRLLRVAFANLAPYVWDSSRSLSQIGWLPPALLDRLPAFTALGLVGVLCVRRRVDGLVWLACSAMTFAATLLSAGIWGSHHAAYGLAFLVPALACALDELRGGAVARAAVLLVACSWAALLLRLPELRPDVGTGFDKDRLLAFVARSGVDERNVVVHASWGTLHQHRLFAGRGAAVAALDEPWRRTAEWRRVGESARGRGRGVAVVADAVTLERCEGMLRATLGPPVLRRDFGAWRLLEFMP